MNRLLVTLLLASSAFAATSAPAEATTADRIAIAQAAKVRYYRSLTPCANEDGSGGKLPCYWDAKARGNGQGRSFWIDTRGGTHYLP